jgi:hypothetical protein
MAPEEYKRRLRSWFLFNGHPDRGEQKTFREWLARKKHIRASESSVDTSKPAIDGQVKASQRRRRSSRRCCSALHDGGASCVFGEYHNSDPCEIAAL